MFLVCICIRNGLFQGRCILQGNVIQVRLSDIIQSATLRLLSMPIHAPQMLLYTPTSPTLPQAEHGRIQLPVSSPCRPRTQTWNRILISCHAQFRLRRTVMPTVFHATISVSVMHKCKITDGTYLSQFRQVAAFRGRRGDFLHGDFEMFHADYAFTGWRSRRADIRGIGLWILRF